MTMEASGARSVRLPAVADFFYPGARSALADQVRTLLRGAGVPLGPRPRAVVAPHAGYRFSGPVASKAFALLTSSDVSLVFVLGPAHRHPVQGGALPRARAFRTPLGDVLLEENVCAELLEEEWIVESDEAHSKEHSIEVELPFLQMALPRAFRVVPLLIGGARPSQVARIFERYWELPGVLFVVSTDLSHFLDSETARRKDAETMERIVSLHAPDLSGEDACGFRAVNGLIEFARGRGLESKCLGLETSGDHGAGLSRVVGYGAVGFWGNSIGA